MTRTVAVSGVALPLGQSIARAALASTRRYRVIGLDLAEEDALAVPELEFRRGAHVRDPDYDARMCDLLRSEKVNLFVPGAEVELRHLAERRERFEQAAGCRLLTNVPAVLDTGQDKLETARLLERHGLAFPRTAALDGGLKEARRAATRLGFPCIAKGRRAGAPLTVHEAADVDYVWRRHRDYVLQEYLGRADDPEFTWGVFSTGDDRFCSSFGFERQLRYGLTWRARRVLDPAMAAYVEEAVACLGAVGPVNVQLRLRGDEPVLHEFNVRCSSSSVFRALCGWNEIDMAMDWLVEGTTPSPGPLRQSGVAVRTFAEHWFDARAGRP